MGRSRRGLSLANKRARIIIKEITVTEIKRVHFTLPLPPGINSQYTQVGKKRVLSKEHVAFKRQVKHRMHRLRVDEIITDAFINALNQGWIGLFLDFYFETPRRRDLDGGLKITQDAILEALAINDNRVVDIHLVKRIAPTHPRVEVELEAIPTWQFDDEYVYLEQPEDGE
jgi:crossover junction endodeoxyribonuclease RusA